MIDDAPASLAEIVAADGEVRIQSKAFEGSSDGFVARKITVETDEDWNRARKPLRII